jgi:hypothetical protein
MTCVILQDDSESTEDQSRAAEHTSGLVRTSLEASRSPLMTRLGRLRCHEGDRLGRATRSLLLRPHKYRVSTDY